MHIFQHCDKMSSLCLIKLPMWRNFNYFYIFILLYCVVLDSLKYYDYVTTWAVLYNNKYFLMHSNFKTMRDILNHLWNKILCSMQFGHLEEAGGMITKIDWTDLKLSDIEKEDTIPMNYKITFTGFYFDVFWCIVNTRVIAHVMHRKDILGCLISSRVF